MPPDSLWPGGQWDPLLDAADAVAALEEAAAEAEAARAEHLAADLAELGAEGAPVATPVLIVPPADRLHAVRLAARFSAPVDAIQTPRGDSLARRVVARLAALGSDLGELAQIVDPGIGDPLVTPAEIRAAVALADGDPAVAPLVAAWLAPPLAMPPAGLLPGGPVVDDADGLAEWLVVRFQRDDAALASCRPWDAPRVGEALAELLADQPGDGNRRLGVRRGDTTSMPARVAARMAEVGVDLDALAARVGVLAGTVNPGSLARAITACPAANPLAALADVEVEGEDWVEAAAEAEAAAVWEDLAELLAFALDAADPDTLLPWGPIALPLSHTLAVEVRAVSPWPGAARAAARVLHLRAALPPLPPPPPPPAAWPALWTPWPEDAVSPMWPVGVFGGRVRDASDAGGLDLAALAARVSAVVGCPVAAGTLARVIAMAEEASTCEETGQLEPEPVLEHLAVALGDALGTDARALLLGGAPTPGPCPALERARWHRLNHAAADLLAPAIRLAARAGVALAPPADRTPAETAALATLAWAIGPRGPAPPVAPLMPRSRPSPPRWRRGMRSGRRGPPRWRRLPHASIRRRGS